MSVHADLSFIAVRNLLHDRMRFAITVAGITVAIWLVFLQGGIYLGFMGNASSMIDKSGADIWIVSRNSPNFDWSKPFPERYLSKVRSTDGVLKAQTLIFAWAFMRMPGGGTEQVELIGYHPSRAESGWGEPWGFTQGGVMSVVGGDYITVDESSRKRLGGLGLGDRVEIFGMEVRVSAVTKGIRSLTTAPYIFTSYGTAQKLAGYLGSKNTVFILVKAAPGVPPRELKARLQARLPNVDVLTKSEYSGRTKRYWTIQTGMGFGFLIMAALALAVGLAIVGQTIYAATMEHIREYATLKALGATNAEIRSILWIQAGVNAVLGFVLSIGFVVLAAKVLTDLRLTVKIPPELFVLVFIIDLAMCLTASAVSVRKALSLDPAMVFRS